MDHSLLQYGFVEEHDEPLLAAVDSATGFEHEDDSLYGEQHLALPASFPQQVHELAPLVLFTQASYWLGQFRAMLPRSQRLSLHMLVSCFG